MGVRIHKVVLAAALTLAASPSAFAGWQDQASSADAARLVQLPQIRARAIADAQSGVGQSDFRAIRETLAPEGHSVPAGALMGNWHCRQMKLGLSSSYIVYNWFNCTIHPYKGGLLFQKINGSQRSIGFLYPENGAWVYLGSSSTRGEPLHNYSGNTPSIGAEVTPDDQIGLLTGIGNNRLRLEIPAVQESLLDVIELAR